MEIPSIKSDVVGELFGLNVTNSMTTGFLITLIVILICLVLNIVLKKYSTPGKFQIALEELYLMFFDMVNKITVNPKITAQILPIIGTLFIYIGIANTLNVIPTGVINIDTTDGAVSLFRSHTTDISVTFAIAIAVAIWTQIVSIQRFNLWNHINKYIRINAVIAAFRQGVGAGILSFIVDFVLLGPLDFISELAKPVSLSLRLFGNMLAGLILGALMFSALPVVGPSFLDLYGLFTGLLQALIFGSLSASYFASALSEEESLD